MAYNDAITSSILINGMKNWFILVLALLLVVCESCTSSSQIYGSFTYVYEGIPGGKEFRFTRQPNQFEYYSRIEGGIRDYSEGTWTQNRKQIFLNGFPDRDISFLNIESKIEDASSSNKDSVFVRYQGNPFNLFHKVDIWVNEYSGVRVTGDTTLSLDTRIKTLQVKSYFDYEGYYLPGNLSKIDTLYSSKIEVNNQDDKHKKVLLKFDISNRDFQRIKLMDTIDIKNKRTLIWRTLKFRKIKE